MTIVAGTRLGRYEIRSKVGEGGMGEVYLAQDTELDRKVAIKFLPESLVADDHARERLIREAQAAAKLDHPNICSIYEVSEEGGRSFIVMQYIEGETLDARLKRQPLKLKESLLIARQIAEGLSDSHEHRIIHRDIKPANIMISARGQVKVMDFGLAMIAPESALTDSEAETELFLTAPGTVMGTVPYMSPEQVRGEQLDARSDIFSFGSVLYEMLSGRRPFDGTSGVDRITAILKDEPETLAHDESGINPALDRVVRRCLEKSREHRFQAMRDVLFALEAVSDWSPSPSAKIAQIAPKNRLAIPLAIAASVAFLVFGLLIGRWTVSNHAAAREPASFSLTLPARAQIASGLSPTVAISPDGTHIAYVVADAGHTQLYLRAIDQVDGNAIPGTDGADGLFFSPDNRWLGFFADHKLKKIAVAGGASVTLCDAGTPLGGSWGPDDMIIFASVPDAGLSIVPASGGLSKVLTKPDFTKGDSNYFWPEILPGGKAVIFTAFTSSGKGRIDVWSLPTGERHTLIDEGTNARYGNGFLLFSRAGALLAAPFDLQHLQVKGAAVPVLEGVAPTNIGGAQFSLSGNGTLVYIAGAAPEISRTLVWVDRAGTPQPISAPPRAYQDPRIAPDGHRLVIEIYPGASGDLWMFDLDRSTLSRLTYEGFENETPVWMSDSQHVAFSSSRVGVQRALFLKAVGETNGDAQLVATANHTHLTSASPDGQFLAFTQYDPLTQGDIWVLPLTGSRPPQPFLKTPFHEWGAVFSPDSHWIAYVSNESGRDEIYVQAFPESGQKVQISTEGGKEPAWARSGELFYRNGLKMMAVSITTKPSVIIGKPHELFEGPYDSGLPLGHTNYDVSADGRRFVMIQTQHQEGTATRVNVRLDWAQQFPPASSAAR